MIKAVQGYLKYSLRNLCCLWRAAQLLLHHVSPRHRHWLGYFFILQSLKMGEYFAVLIARPLDQRLRVIECWRCRHFAQLIAPETQEHVLNEVQVVEVFSELRIGSPVF